MPSASTARVAGEQQATRTVRIKLLRRRSTSPMVIRLRFAGSRQREAGCAHRATHEGTSLPPGCSTRSVLGEESIQVSAVRKPQVSGLSTNNHNIGPRILGSGAPLPRPEIVHVASAAPPLTPPTRRARRPGRGNGEKQDAPGCAPFCCRVPITTNKGFHEATEPWWSHHWSHPSTFAYVHWCSVECGDAGRGRQRYSANYYPYF